MQNKNHNELPESSFDAPYIEDGSSIKKPFDHADYEEMLSIYRFISLKKVLILLLVLFVLYFFYSNRTQLVNSGVIIYHGKDQVVYEGVTHYFDYRGGILKLYETKSDWEAENEARIEFQIWMNGSLREIHGADFQPREGYSYDVVARAFIAAPDPDTLKFTTVLGLPFFWTTLFGVLLVVEPRVALLLYTPIALLPARGTGFGSIPRYDPDVNYKLGGIVLLVISFFLFIPLFPNLGEILREIW